MALLAVLRPEHATRIGVDEDGGLRLYVRLRCSSLAHPCHRRQHDGEREQDTGTVIIPTVEGTRPLLVELQALVAPTPYVPPRRTADSVDIKRIQLLLAVLEKRVHLSVGACDVYVKVAGGIRIDEPAADLGICVAMASSFANRLLRPKTIVFGEVGLSGEVRAVSQADLRINEARRLGFTHVVLPMKNYRQLKGSVEGIALYGAETIGDALRLAMPRES